MRVVVRWAVLRRSLEVLGAKVLPLPVVHQRVALRLLLKKHKRGDTHTHTHLGVIR